MNPPFRLPAKYVSHVCYADTPIAQCGRSTREGPPKQFAASDLLANPHYSGARQASLETKAVEPCRKEPIRSTGHMSTQDRRRPALEAAGVSVFLKVGPLSAGPRVGALCALLLAILILAACSSPQPGGSSVADPKSGGTPAATPNRAAPPATSLPSTVGLPSLGDRGAHDDIMVGPGTIYSGCPNGIRTGDQAGSLIPPMNAYNPYSGERINKDRGQVFNPTSGENVAIRLPEIPKGKELGRHACTVAGTQDAVMVYFVMELIHGGAASSATTTTSIVAIDPFSSTPPKQVPWPTSLDFAEFVSIRPTYHGFVLTGNGKSDHPTLAAFDGETLENTFVSNERIDHVNFAGFSTREKDRVNFYDARNGELIGAVDGATHVRRDQKMVHPDGLIYELKESESSQTATDSFKYFYFDLLSGEKSDIETSDQANFGVWRDTLIAWRESRPPYKQKGFIKVMNIADKRVLYERESLEGEDIDAIYLAGNYVYLHMGSEGSVVDITTGEQVASRWNVRPVDVINRDWWLRLDSANDGAGQSCIDGNGKVDCSRSLEIIHAPDGHYDGPWY